METLPKTRPSLASAVALGCLFSPPAVAQDVAEAPLEQIVVVATKYESRVRDIAADVAVLTHDELASTLSTTLEDTFRFLPGVSHEGGGSRFGGEGVNIRGIGGNRVALEIDGVPVSEHFAIGSFSNATRDFLDPALVGQLEVLKGPASALYGSSALGGVVIVRTPDPVRLVGDRRSGGDVGMTYHGRDDSQHWHGRVGLVAEDVSMLLAGSVRAGHEADPAGGMPVGDDRDYRRRAGLVRVAGEFRPGHRWRLSALRQTDDVATETRSVLGTGRFRSTTRLTGDDRLSFRLASAEYALDGIDGWVDEALVRLFVASADIAQHTVDERAAAADPVLIGREFSYDQRLRGGELNLWREAGAAGWLHRLGFGLEWTERLTTELRDGRSRRLVDGRVSPVILGETFPLRDFPVTETREGGAWLSDSMSRGPLTITAALRYDANRLSPRPDAVWREDNPDTDTVSVAVADLSPKLGFVYHLGSDIDLYLQYAEGFRAPPFEDANIGLDIPLFNIRAIPNPDLASETSRGWEAGVRWHGAGARLALSVFQTDYDDFIETRARIGIDPVSGRLLFQSRNIDQARIRGLEASASGSFLTRHGSVTLRAAAYLAEGEDRSSGAALGDVGPAEAVFGADWRSRDDRSALFARLTVVDGWSGGEAPASEEFEPPGYAVLDLWFSRLLGRHLVLRAGVGNLTDRRYWHWGDVRGLAPADPALPVLAEPGRHYSIGLQWDW